MRLAFEIAICFECLLDVSAPRPFCENRGIMVSSCHLAICICYVVGVGVVP